MGRVPGFFVFLFGVLLCYLCCLRCKSLSFFCCDVSASIAIRQRDEGVGARGDVSECYDSKKWFLSRLPSLLEIQASSGLSYVTWRERLWNRIRCEKCSVLLRVMSRRCTGGFMTWILTPLVYDWIMTPLVYDWIMTPLVYDWIMTSTNHDWIMTPPNYEKVSWSVDGYIGKCTLCCQ